jgi:hypothetical protein
VEDIVLPKTRDQWIEDLERHYTYDGIYFAKDMNSPDILAVRIQDYLINTKSGWLTQVYKLPHEWFEDDSWGDIYLRLGMPLEQLRKIRGSEVAKAPL